MPDQKPVEKQTPSFDNQSTSPSVSGIVAAMPPSEISAATKVDLLTVKLRMSSVVDKMNKAAERVSASSQSPVDEQIVINNLGAEDHLVDKEIINLLEGPSYTSGFDPSQTRLFTDVAGEINSVRQTKLINAVPVVDQDGTSWAPAIVYHRAFGESQLNGARIEPGKTVKTLSFVKQS